LSTPTTHSDPQLSAATAEALVERIAHVGEGSGHLPAGLRAAADETDSFRLAAALRHVASEVERGRPLDDVIAGATRRLPPNLAGLIRGAQRTGQLGTVLVEWIENRRAARVHWSAVESAMIYPITTLVIAVGICILFAVAIVRPFHEMIEEMEVRTPVNLNAIYWLSTTGLNWLFILSIAFVVMLVPLRLIGGRVAWSWTLSQLPLIGGTWHWTGVAEALRSLSLLIEHRVPLPEALRLAGDGATDAYVGGLLRNLAQRVAGGVPLFLAIIQQRGLPLSIVPLVRWGEQTGSLADGLRSAAEMLEGRLRLKSLLLIQIFPPLIFILVAALVLSFISVVAGTMLTLLRGLA
jgi:type II secretory pathway component PulF